jgi:glycerophosphoryl diester phosphodiesterase
MVPSLSSVKRIEDLDAKTVQIDGLIAEIVPLIDELDEKGLRDIKIVIDTKVRAAKHELAKESTKVYIKGTLLRPS